MSSEFDFGGSVPAWGRSAAEYEAFFALSDVSLSDVSPSARVLDCGSGPSSFAAEWGKSGRFVVAVDPIYRFSVRDLESNFERTSARMLAGMRTARDRFRWDHYGSPEEVLRLRSDVLNAFLCDFQSVTRRGRYVSGSLPELPFRSKSFDLVLCSHLLFLYSAEFNLETHLSFLLELLRVGREVRVFPLFDLAGEPSRHLDVTIQVLRRSADVELVSVPFRFGPGDSKMLRLTQA